MAKFEGRGACAHCAKGVDVYSDKNGLAYYNCGPCGVRVVHRNRRTSDAVLAKLDREAQEDGGKPEPTPAPAPTPAPTSAPARQAQRQPSPGQPQPPAPQPRSGFLSNFTL